MNGARKLFEHLCKNPKSVQFREACRAAKLLGFTIEAGRGSHRVFKMTGEPAQLNFQNRDGYIPPYKARQLIAMIRKYGDS